MSSRPGSAPRSIVHECDSAHAGRFHCVIILGVVSSTVGAPHELFGREMWRRETWLRVVNGCLFDAEPVTATYRS